MTPPGNSAKIEEKQNEIIRLLAGLTEGLNKEFDEVKKSVRDNAVDYQTTQIAYTKENAVMDGKLIAVQLRAEAQQKEIDTMKEDIRDIKKAVVPLVFWAKIATFVATILGGTLIIFVWSLITHAVTIMVP